MSKRGVLFLGLIWMAGLMGVLQTPAGAADADAFESLPLQRQYLVLLEPWVKAALTEIRPLGNDMAVYGLAQSGHWYMQAHDTAFCAFAVLGTDPGTDEKRVGMTQAEMRRIALAMLRYTLRSHIAGGGVCTDGKAWGHTWISSLGLERMTVGIEALEDHLDPELKTLYAKVCASEADYLLKQPVKAGLTTDNHPESNMWQGIISHRAAVLNPEHPNAAKWREQASLLLVNSMATPTDAENAAIVDGKPVSARFVGANMFESRACNHHGYQNVGYMNIAESNLGIYHFWCKRRGATPPEALYHNALEQWKVMKACTFGDGRLARVGGDSRVRYCYCQDYAILVWLLARDRFGDADTEAFERGWLRQVRTEQLANPDGWYMRERLEPMRRLSPLYFQRLEGDKACSLACGAYWRRVFAFDALPTKSVAAPTRWHDPFHGTWLQRGEKRFASWTWQGAMKAGGLCVPSGASDMAEWQFNLAGQVFGVGEQNYGLPRKWTGYAFDGGFATCGFSELLSKKGLAEGADNPEVGRIFLAYCALPDDRTSVVIQRACTENDAYLVRVRGLALSVPNDVFNGFSRTLRTADGVRTLKAVPEAFELVGNGGRWLNLDDKLGVVEIYGGSPKVARVPGRQIGLNIWSQEPKRGGGYLYCDEVCQVASEGPKRYGRRETIFDCGAVVMTADAQSTGNYADGGGISRVETGDPDLRAVKVKDALGNGWFILVNFSESPKVLERVALVGWMGGQADSLHAAQDALEPLGIGVWKMRQPLGVAGW